MRYFMFEYFYDLGDDTHGKPCVSYVLRAYDTQEAIELMAGLHHPDYTERAISPIAEDEYDILKTDQLDVGVWRVTREQTRIIAVLNNRQNYRLFHGIRADISLIQDTLRTA